MRSRKDKKGHGHGVARVLACTLCLIKDSSYFFEHFWPRSIDETAYSFLIDTPHPFMHASCLLELYSTVFR